MALTFNAIGLAVADMATSFSFYRLLGLEFPAGSEHEPHAEALLPGDIRLMFDAAGDPSSTKDDEPSAKDHEPSAKGGPSLAFLCADPAEVDRVHAILADAGHHTVNAPWDADWGQRYAIVRDPDGYQVELFAWIKTPD
jgi:catechol 2,3-dioxygenase-like lactoylglutathione lyase family enzyme